MSIINKVRSWIDGETSERVLEDAARDAEVRPRSKAEEFIVKIARSVEEVMQAELVPLPQGTAIIPTQYTIFLSDPDDREWQGVKRRGLEQGLYHILAERSRELAGARKLETASFTLEFRVDGTLETSEIRVTHGWEDNSGPKTQVLKRPQPDSESAGPSPSPTDVAPPLERTGPTPQTRVSPAPVPTSGHGTGHGHQTGDEEMTQVGKRSAELYRLEIWKDGLRHNVVPIFTRETVIGRGSKTRPVDVALPGDPEISRRHITLNVDEAGSFWLTNEGRNAVVVEGTEILTNQKVRIAPAMLVAVCSYTLRIQG